MLPAHSLPYVEATLNEVFRFRGAATFTVPHSAMRDTVLRVSNLSQIVYDPLFSLLIVFPAFINHFMKL